MTEFLFFHWLVWFYKFSCRKIGSFYLYFSVPTFAPPSRLQVILYFWIRCSISINLIAIYSKTASSGSIWILSTVDLNKTILVLLHSLQIKTFFFSGFKFNCNISVYKYLLPFYRRMRFRMTITIASQLERNEIFVLFQEELMNVCLIAGEGWEPFHFLLKNDEILFDCYLSLFSHRSGN